MTAKKATTGKASPKKDTDVLTPSIEELQAEVAKLNDENAGLKACVAETDLEKENLLERLKEAEDKLQSATAEKVPDEYKPEPEPEKNKDGFVPGSMMSFDDIQKAKKVQAQRKAEEQ